MIDWRATLEEVQTRRNILFDMKRMAEQCEQTQVVLASLERIEVELLLLKLFINSKY